MKAEQTQRKFANENSNGYTQYIYGLIFNQRMNQRNEGMENHEVQTLQKISYNVTLLMMELQTF